MPLGTTTALETLKAVLKAVDPSWRSGVAVAMLSAAVCWPLHLVLDLLRA